MEFEEYLISKKIDPAGLKKGNPALYKSFKELFSQVHPDSFTAQKLFLLNQIRRQFHYTAPSATETSTPAATKPSRPKMMPKFKKPS